MSARSAHGAFEPVSVTFWMSTADPSEAKKRPKRYTQCGFLSKRRFGISGLAYERSLHVNSNRFFARRSGNNGCFDEAAAASRGSEKGKKCFKPMVS